MYFAALFHRFTVLGCFLFVLGSLSVLAQAAPVEEGFISIFDGKTLDGWDGNPKFWRVEDGAITGETTKETPTKGNTFVIWRNGKPADFELRLQYKLFNHNSGIQYRSVEKPKEWGRWVVGGYQADMEGGDRYSGILYEEKMRGILALRGQKTVIGENHKPKVVGSVGDAAKLQSYVKKADWNDYRIIAKGNHFIHEINGHVMVDVTDADAQAYRREGILALQMHQGPPMKVQFRNIRLKQLPRDKKKKVVFIAGRKSHGYGAHEHYAGCVLLAKCLNENVPGIEAVVYRDADPKTDAALATADTIVVFADGGERHPLMHRLKEVGKLMDRGVGLACLHYGVEIPKGEPGDCLLKWIGGYFETDWSVNPHFMADFPTIAKHAVTRGVQPFSIDDEWYYHMRFPKDMKGVTAVLTTTPPESTRERPDGPHSNNPTVRARKGMPEHVAWVYQRPDGGRGFGFTGGHWHWNWAQDDFRTLVLNAIVWTAKLDVPSEGVPFKTPTLSELEADQDYPQPKNFDKAKWQKLLNSWNK